MMPLVLLDGEVRAALDRAGTRAPDREFVGLLAGARTLSHWHVTTMRPLPNVAPSGDRFEVDAAAFARTEAALRADGREWLGFVHDHPHGSAALSAIDRAQLWRGCLQLVVGGGPAARELRAYVGDAHGWHVLRILAPGVAQPS